MSFDNNYDDDDDEEQISGENKILLRFESNR